MEIIVPAAGLSTRFPNMKPKYLLSDKNGRMMLAKSINPYLTEGHKVTVGILQAHIDKYDAYNLLKTEFGDTINIVVIPKVTTGPADTAYQIIKATNISEDSEFLIKDCDSYFTHTNTPGNYVCISRIANHFMLSNLAAKSFVVSNEQGIITDIIEKKVVSDKFCVGGYKFESIKLFVDTYEKLNSDVKNEIFVSHIIQECLMNNCIFFEKDVQGYSDVGTIEAWQKYNESLT